MFATPIDSNVRTGAGEESKEFEARLRGTAEVRIVSRRAAFAPKQERGPMSISKFRRGLLATAAVLASFSAAFAQTQTAANTTSGIETVVVTAQYKTQNLQTTPLSITAVTANDLEQRGINDLSQLATSVPNLTLTKTPAAFGSGVQTYIRGVGQYDTAFASEPGVGMYIDDEYYGTMFGSNMELLDLSRVEVLRGPQGVLGGKDNIGGAIKLYSKQPTGDDSGYVSASYGSFNEIDVKGAIDVTVVPDKLFARVSALSRHQDGYMDIIDYVCKFGNGTGPTGGGSMPSVGTSKNCKIGTLGGTDVTGARLAFRGVIHEGMEDNFDAYVIRDNSETQAGSLIVADPGTDPSGLGRWNPNNDVYYWNGSKVVAVPRNSFYPANSDGPTTVTGPGAWNAFNLSHFGIPWDQRFIPQDPYRQTYATYTSLQGNQYRDGARVHAWGLNNQFDWDILSNVHFKNILGYREYQAANSNDSDLSPMSYQLTTSYPTNDEFQEEARFTGTLLDDRLDWTGGFFYYHRNNHERGPVDIEGAFAPFLIFEQNDLYQSTSRSVYLHGIYHIWDNLEVFGGVRYSSESKTLYFDHSGPVPGYPGSGFFCSTVDPQFSCNIFDPSVPPCDHSINPPLLAHTSRVSRPDWRAGVDYHVTDDIMTYFQFSTGYRTGGFNSRPFTPAQLDSYGPEHLEAYEIGAKTDWLDHRLRLNVSLFHSEYSDIITPTAGTDPYLPGILPYVKYVNLASATNDGFELEATVNPVSNLLIDASYSYVHFSASPVPGAPPGWLDGCSAAGYAAGLCDANPKNLTLPFPPFTEAPHTAPGTTRVGSHPILFPANTAHIGAQWPFMLGEGMGTLTPRLDYSWQDTIYQGANNDPFTAIKARGLLDGRLTWDAPSGGWSVSLSGSNLTDKKYFLNVFDLSIFGQGSVEGQPGTPREWLITVKKNF